LKAQGAWRKAQGKGPGVGGQGSEGRLQQTHFKFHI
jgi:hypothetical protein